jgi:hypothetical protein
MCKEVSLPKAKTAKQTTNPPVISLAASTAASIEELTKPDIADTSES